jgi:hypothetical protein
VAWLDDGLVLLGPGVDLPRRIVTTGGGAMPCHLDPTDDPLVLRARDGRLAGELLRFLENGGGEVDRFGLIGLTFHRVQVGE